MRLKAHAACLFLTSLWVGCGPARSNSHAAIKNTPPFISAVKLSPENPLADSTVTAEAIGARDADGDSVKISVFWKKNGKIAQGETRLTFQGSIEKGDVLSVTLTPSDGKADGQPVTAKTQVGNSRPMVSAVGLSNPNIVAGIDTDPLTLSYQVSDADAADQPTVSIRWFKNGTAVPAFNDQASIPYAQQKSNDLWLATVVANDGTDTSDEAVSPAIAIILSVFDPFTTPASSLWDLLAVQNTATLNSQILSDVPCPTNAAYRCRNVRFSSPFPNGSQTPLTTAAWVVVPANITKPLAALIVLHDYDGARERDGMVLTLEGLDAYQPYSTHQLAIISISGPGAEGSSGQASGAGLKNLFPDVREHWDYLYAYAAMRTVTYAQTITEVDTTHIGMSGVSAGGKATLLANGIDDRLAAAIVRSASGYFLESAAQDSWLSALSSSVPAVTAATELWLDPRSYLSTQQAPLKLLGGAQDEIYPLTTVRHTCNSLPSSLAKSIFVAANMDHYTYYVDDDELYDSFNNANAVVDMGISEGAWIAAYLLGISPMVQFGPAPSAPVLSVSGNTVQVSVNIPPVTITSNVTTATHTASSSVKLYASNDNGWTFFDYPMASTNASMYTWSGAKSGVWSSPSTVVWFAVSKDTIDDPGFTAPYVVDFRSSPPTYPLNFQQRLRPAP